MDIANKFYRKKKIGNNEYQITLMPALTAISKAKVLSKIILPAFGGAIDGLRDDGFSGPPKTFSDLAIRLCTQLDNIDLDDLIITLLRGLVCNGKEVKDINTHFQGDIGELIAVIEFSLKENFSGFFGASDLLALLKGMMTEMGVSDLTSIDL